MSSYYDLLGVSPNTNAQDLKRAYRKLAGLYHPDHNPGDAQAETKFKQINEAYAVLNDTAKRQEYDQEHNQAHPKQPWPGEPFDIKPQYGHHEQATARAKTMQENFAKEDLYKQMLGGYRPPWFEDSVDKFFARTKNFWLALFALIAFMVCLPKLFIWIVLKIYTAFNFGQ